MCGQSKEFKFDAVPCWEAAADKTMGAVPEPCDPASELDFDLDPSSIQLGEWCEYHEARNPRPARSKVSLLSMLVSQPFFN